MIKKNNKVKFFKSQAQTALALGIFTLDSSSFLLPTAHIHCHSSRDRLCPTTEICWTVVSGLAF